MPQNNIELAASLVSWWKELTGLFIGFLALFGIIVKSKKGANLVTKTDLSLALAENNISLERALSAHSDSIKSKMDDSMKQIYVDMRTGDYRVNKRVDELMKNK